MSVSGEIADALATILAWDNAVDLANLAPKYRFFYFCGDICGFGFLRCRVVALGNGYHDAFRHSIGDALWRPDFV